MAPVQWEKAYVRAVYEDMRVRLTLYRRQGQLWSAQSFC